MAGKDLLVNPIAIVDGAILMSLSYTFSLSIYYICIYECVYIVRWCCLMHCDTSETFSSMIILQRSGGDCNREVCFIPTWKGEASEALKHSEKAKLVRHPYHPHIIPYLSFHLSFSTNKKHPNLPLTTPTIPWFILSQVLAGGFDCIDGPGGSRRSCGSRSSSSVPGVHPGWWFHNYPWP